MPILCAFVTHQTPSFLLRSAACLMRGTDRKTHPGDDSLWKVHDHTTPPTRQWARLGSETATASTRTSLPWAPGGPVAQDEGPWCHVALGRSVWSHHRGRVLPAFTPKGKSNPPTQATPAPSLSGPRSVPRSVPSSNGRKLGPVQLAQELPNRQQPPSWNPARGLSTCSFRQLVLQVLRGSSPSAPGTAEMQDESLARGGVSASQIC